MKWFLVFGIISIIADAPITLAGDSEEDSSSSDSNSSSSFPEKSTKSTSVKLIKVSILQVSYNYYNKGGIIAVKKVNESYNALAIDFTVAEDLPLDTKVVVKVYGSESKDGNYESISSYTLGLGDTSHKYYKYLPAGVIESCQSAKTLKKGSYKSEDYGYFKFEKLLTKKQLKHSYFKMIYNYECDSEVIFSLDTRFQSNCKN